MTERICGALGCTNDAIARIERDGGAKVWACQSCASKRHTVEVAGI